MFGSGISSLARKAGYLATGAGVAVAVTLGAVSPASGLTVSPMNSFSGTDGTAKWSYNDGTDSFCATSLYMPINVTLSPVTAGRGPTYDHVRIAGGGHKCFSLATAYEDSKYNWGVGDVNDYNSGTFYS